jgi:hypothetical protein
MRKLALLAAVTVLGASSAAFADDVTVRDHRDRFGDRIDRDRLDRHDDRFDNDNDRDGQIYTYDDDDDFGEARFTRDQDGQYWRDGRRFVRQDYQPKWVSLGSAGSGKTGIRVGADMGRFQSLRLDVNGYMRIRQVVVHFSDGTFQRVRMTSAMSSRSAPLVIDLSGTKKIDRIFVYAGQFGRGTVSISALQGKRFYWKRYHAER